MKIGKFNTKEILKLQVKQHSNPKKRFLTVKRKNLRSRDISFIKKFFIKSKSILSIGSREDSEVQHFINEGYKSVGIDISNETKLIKKCDAHNLDKFFKNRKFDIVYASHVLEHMIDPNKVMKNIRNISKEGIVILLPLSPKGPRKKHPAIFEIMRVKEDKDIFIHPLQHKNVWNDFKIFEPYNILYCEYRDGINEREVLICLKFNK